MKKFAIALIVMVSLFVLTACTDTVSYAPVINGWKRPPADSDYYIVQPGDTLYSIAWAFGMDYGEIARVNHLRPPYAIQAGQRLNMRVTMAAPPVVEHTAMPSVRPQPVRVKRPIKQSLVAVSQPIKPLPRVSEYSKQPAHKVTNKPATIMPSVSSPLAVKWVWPTQGKIILGYSTASGGNKGIDIAGKLGQPVVASAPGIVVYSSSHLRAYGQLILIKHADGYLSGYAFNKVLLVKVGDQVKAGQKIAEMGQDDSGRVILHFEIRRNGKTVNPLDYLKSR